jgi:hypothetical protein
MRRVSVAEMLKLAKLRDDPPGRLLLHEELARAKPNESVIEALLASNSERASTPNDSGSLPVHVASGRIHDLDSSILLALMDAYPPALSYENVHGLLPLHKAVMAPLVSSSKRANLDNITMLIEGYEPALKARTRTGQVPLHLAVSTPKVVSSELVELLLESGNVSSSSSSVGSSSKGSAGSSSKSSSGKKGGNGSGKKSVQGGGDASHSHNTDVSHSPNSILSKKGGGSSSKQPQQQRFRDGVAVTSKGEKYITIKEGEEWDGGSRGRVVLKGKRGAGGVKLAK